MERSWASSNIVPGSGFPITAMPIWTEDVKCQPALRAAFSNIHISIPPHGLPKLLAGYQPNIALDPDARWYISSHGPLFEKERALPEGKMIAYVNFHRRLTGFFAFELWVEIDLANDAAVISGIRYETAPNTLPFSEDGAKKWAWVVCRWLLDCDPQVGSDESWWDPRMNEWGVCPNPKTHVFPSDEKVLEEVQEKEDELQSKTRLAQAYFLMYQTWTSVPEGERRDLSLVEQDLFPGVPEDTLATLREIAPGIELGGPSDARSDNGPRHYA